MPTTRTTGAPEPGQQSSVPDGRRVSSGRCRLEPPSVPLGVENATSPGTPKWTAGKARAGGRLRWRGSGSRRPGSGSSRRPRTRRTGRRAARCPTARPHRPRLSSIHRSSVRAARPDAAILLGSPRRPLLRQRHRAGAGPQRSLSPAPSAMHSCAAITWHSSTRSSASTVRCAPASSSAEGNGRSRVAHNRPASLRMIRHPANTGRVTATALLCVMGQDHHPVQGVRTAVATPADPDFGRVTSDYNSA